MERVLRITKITNVLPSRSVVRSREKTVLKTTFADMVNFSFALRFTCLRNKIKLESRRLHPHNTEKLKAVMISNRAASEGFNLVAHAETGK